MPRRTLASVRALARGVAALAGALATLLVARAACADPPWTSRRMTLGQGELAGNVGFGFADDAAQDVTGVGLYFQVAYGITDRLEVLVRDGVRFGTYGQYARAEQYGRLYSTDGAVSPGPGPVSNPDLVVLWRFLDLGFLELGAEGEVGFPVEPKTNVAATAGLAVTLHYAPWLRFDTGFYTTLAFSAPVQPTYVVPFEFWFQTGEFPLWFGPLAALQTTGTSGTWTLPLGFGAGYAVTKDIDVRAEMLIPQASSPPGTSDLGFGLGVEVRYGTAPR